MSTKFSHPLFVKLFSLLVLASLAFVPLGAALAAQNSDENIAPPPLVETKNQPLGINPAAGNFSPRLITTTASYAGPVFNIPDFVWAGTCFPLNISATGTITDVRLTNVAITHTWVGDLRLDLYHPGGSFLTILNRAPVGPTTTWSNLIATSPLQFYDGAATDAGAIPNALVGTDSVICQDNGLCDYSPNPDGYPSSVTNFAAFDGLNPNGTWQVCIADGGSGDTGSISAFTLQVSTTTQPTVAITSTETSPTNNSPIPVTITFNSLVTGFAVGDITVGNGTATNFAGSGTTYTVDITPTASGIVTVDVPQNAAFDLGNTGNAAATQFSITYDSGAPSPTIISTATNPTGTSPIPVTITFNENVTGFTASDITVTNGTVGNFVGTDPGQIYTADITPLANGLVTINVNAGVATDLSSNANTAATPFSITYATGTPITVSSLSLASVMRPGPSSFDVVFSKDASDPAGNTGTDDVTNPANYILVQIGSNNVFDTVSCLGGPVADDQAITVNNVSYNNASFTSTVAINNGVQLPVGTYRLYVCGTTSIVEATTGIALNAGTDFIFNFTVEQETSAGTSASSRAKNAPSKLPDTGFAPGKITKLPAQPIEKAYADLGDLWIEIPSLGVKMSILGVPRSGDSWDVSWLGQNAGWLEGTAFPTWDGNSVITGHVWDALNNPGPFYNLKNLKYGDTILIHAWEYVYTYEVRSLTQVTPRNTTAVTKREKLAWLTLITCENFNPDTNNYQHRRLVRAVLVSVAKEK